MSHGCSYSEYLKESVSMMFRLKPCTFIWRSVLRYNLILSDLCLCLAVHTVNSEIFVRNLFSQIELKDILATFKIQVSRK